MNAILMLNFYGYYTVAGSWTQQLFVSTFMSDFAEVCNEGRSGNFLLSTVLNLEYSYIPNFKNSLLAWSAMTTVYLKGSCRILSLGREK